MLHLSEVIAAEIYARDGIVVLCSEAREGSLETMGFKRRFFWYFSFADERKVRTFPCQSLRLLPTAKSTSSPHSVTFGDISPRWGESCPLHKGGLGLSTPTKHNKIYHIYPKEKQNHVC